MLFCLLCSCVIEPYTKHPNLLEVLLSLLKGEQVHSIRREVWQCICDQAYENQPCEHTKIADFHLCCIITHKLQIMCTNKISITTAEFNGVKVTEMGYLIQS